MFEMILDRFTKVLEALPFTGPTWFVLFTLGFFIWMLAKANHDPRSLINWEHIIVDSSNNRASPYKIGYLVGLIVGTWIVLTLLDKNHLSYDTFGMYLTYLLGGAGWNSFVKGKESTKFTPPEINLQDQEAETPPPPASKPTSKQGDDQLFN